MKNDEAHKVGLPSFKIGNLFGNSSSSKETQQYNPFSDTLESDEDDDDNPFSYASPSSVNSYSSRDSIIKQRKRTSEPSWVNEKSPLLQPQSSSSTISYNNKLLYDGEWDVDCNLCDPTNQDASQMFWASMTLMGGKYKVWCVYYINLPFSDEEIEKYHIRGLL